MRLEAVATQRAVDLPVGVQMRLFSLGLAVLLALSLSPPNAFAMAARPDQAAGPSATDAVVSALPNSIVKVVRRPKGMNDPLSKYGGGLYVAVGNRGEQAFDFSPASVTIVTSKGKPLAILSDADIASKVEAAAARRRTFGALMGVSVAVLSGAAAGYGADIDPVAASNLMQGGVLVATNLASDGELAANSVQYSGEVALATYQERPLNALRLDPQKTTSGRVIVDGLKDSIAITVTIRTGSETHVLSLSEISR